MNYYQIVKKLIGEIDPIGESHADEVRRKNLDNWIDLSEIMIVDLIEISRNQNRKEASMKVIGNDAMGCIVDIKNRIDEYFKELNG